MEDEIKKALNKIAKRIEAAGYDAAEVRALVCRIDDPNLSNLGDHVLESCIMLLNYALKDISTLTGEPLKLIES